MPLVNDLDDAGRMTSPLERSRRRMKLQTMALLIGGLLALSPVDVAFANRFDDGLAAYRKEDFATALLVWRTLAENGDALAQVYLGLLYLNGEGVPQNPALAVKWYRKAA